MKLNRYFKYILNPSLLDHDEAKNMVPLIAQNLPMLLKLFRCVDKIVGLIFAKSSNISTNQLYDIFLGIRYLLGLGAPYRMTYPQRIDSAFHFIRSQLLDRNTFFDRRNFLLQHLFATFISRQSLSIHFKNNADDDESAKGVVTSLSGIQRPPTDCLGDILCQILVDVSHLDLETKTERLKITLRELFAVPAFTYVISTSYLQSTLATSEILAVLLSLFSDSAQIVLPPSPIPAFKSGQWLVGNMTSLCSFLPLDPRVSAQDQREIINDQMLISYFNLLSVFFLKYEVPSVWQGRRGVIWTRDGSTLIAAAIPRALQYQLLSFCDGLNTKRLYTRCIAPLGNVSGVSPQNNQKQSSISPIEGKTIYPRKKDISEVFESLSSTGLKMARESLIEQKQASDSWLGSGWASKMVKSVTKAFNRFNSSEQAPSQNNVVEALKESISEVDRDDQDISPFLPNDTLASTLCKLWSVILPQAASSPPESVCWRGLSVLCFSTRAVNKLWGLAVRCGSPQSLFSSGDDPFHLSFSLISGEITMSRDLIPGNANGLEIIISMVAIMKVVCIALDDSELYDRGVGNSF